MRIINAIVDALRRVFGTDKIPQIDSVEIWEDYPDHFKFRYGSITWGSFPTYADAERVAVKFNALIVNKKTERK